MDARRASIEMKHVAGSSFASFPHKEGGDEEEGGFGGEEGEGNAEADPFIEDAANVTTMKRLMLKSLSKHKIRGLNASEDVMIPPPEDESSPSTSRTSLCAIFWFAVVVALVLVFLHWGRNRHFGPEPPPPDRPGFGTARRVMLIDISGFGSKQALTSNSQHPGINQFGARGSFSFKVRTVLPLENKPLWAALLTGALPTENGVDSDAWYPAQCQKYTANDAECQACAVCEQISSALQPLVSSITSHSNVNTTLLLEQANVKSVCSALNEKSQLCEQQASLMLDTYIDAIVSHRTIDNGCYRISAQQSNGTNYTPCRERIPSLVGGNDLNSAPVEYPTIFGIAKAAKRRFPMTTLCYTQSSSLLSVIEKDVLDYVGLEMDGNKLIDSFENLIATKQNKDSPRVMFFQFSAIMDAASKHGVDSEAYNNAVSDVDAWVSRLFAILEEHEMLEETLVLLVSDHGINDTPDRVDAASLLVPLLARGPQIRPNNTLLSRRISLVDLAPTMLYALGIRPDTPSITGLPIFELWRP